MNEELLILKAYVEISSYRVRAMKAIGIGYKNPTEIAHDSDIRPNHISKVLKELKEHDLAVCINENVRKGRLYKLTATGREILEEMKLK